MAMNALGSHPMSPEASGIGSSAGLLASAPPREVLKAVGVAGAAWMGKMELVRQGQGEAYFARDSRGVLYPLKARFSDEYAAQEIRQNLRVGGYTYAHGRSAPSLGALTSKPGANPFSGIGKRPEPANPFASRPASSFLTPSPMTDGMGAGSFSLPQSEPRNLTAPQRLMSPLSPEIQAAVDQRLPGVVNGWFAQLHTALVQFDRGEIRRDQFGNVFAAVKANIARIGWNDKLTEAQQQALRNAERAYSPPMRVQSHSAGVTEKGRDGKSYELKAEVSTTEKLARDGNWYVTEAKITRIYLDNHSGMLGGKQDRILKTPVDVSRGNGFHGHALGAPLRSVDAVLQVALDQLRGGGAMSLWRGESPQDAKGRLIPPRVHTSSETAGAAIKGLGQVAVDFVKGLADLALVPLAGLGELVNTLAYNGNNQQLLIPAAHQYASRFSHGLADLSQFVARHGTAIPGLAVQAFQQELKTINQMVADGNLPGAIEKITYATATLVTALVSLKKLPEGGVKLLNGLKNGLGQAQQVVKQLNQLPTERLNLLKGPNFGLGGKTGELYIPKASPKGPEPVLKPPPTGNLASGARTQPKPADAIEVPNRKGLDGLNPPLPKPDADADKQPVVKPVDLPVKPTQPKLPSSELRSNPELPEPPNAPKVREAVSPGNKPLVTSMQLLRSLEQQIQTAEALHSKGLPIDKQAIKAAWQALNDSVARPGHGLTPSGTERFRDAGNRVEWLTGGAKGSPRGMDSKQAPVPSAKPAASASTPLSASPVPVKPNSLAKPPRAPVLPSTAVSPRPVANELNLPPSTPPAGAKAVLPSTSVPPTLLTTTPAAGARPQASAKGSNRVPDWFVPWRAQLAASSTALSAASRQAIGSQLPAQLSLAEIKHWIKQAGSAGGAGGEVQPYSVATASRPDGFFLGHDLHQMLGAQPDFLGETSTLTYGLNSLKLSSSIKRATLPDVGRGDAFFANYAVFIDAPTQRFPDAVFTGLRSALDTTSPLTSAQLSLAYSSLRSKGLMHSPQAQQGFAGFKSDLLAASGQPAEQLRLVNAYEAELKSQTALTDVAAHEGYVRALAFRDYLAQQLQTAGAGAGATKLNLNFADYRAHLEEMQNQGKLPSLAQVRNWMDAAKVPYMREREPAGQTRSSALPPEPVAALPSGWRFKSTLGINGGSIEILNSHGSSEGVALVNSRTENPFVARLTGIFIEPDKRSQGLDKKLLQQVERELAILGFQMIEAPYPLPGTERFYERAGYRRGDAIYPAWVKSLSGPQSGQNDSNPSPRPRIAPGALPVASPLPDGLSVKHSRNGWTVANTEAMRTLVGADPGLFHGIHAMVDLINRAKWDTVLLNQMVTVSEEVNRGRPLKLQIVKRFEPGSQSEAVLILVYSPADKQRHTFVLKVEHDELTNPNQSRLIGGSKVKPVNSPTTYPDVMRVQERLKQDSGLRSFMERHQIEFARWNFALDAGDARRPAGQPKRHYAILPLYRSVERPTAHDEAVMKEFSRLVDLVLAKNPATSGLVMDQKGADNYLIVNNDAGARQIIVVDPFKRFEHSEKSTLPRPRVPLAPEFQLPSAQAHAVNTFVVLFSRDRLNDAEREALHRWIVRDVATGGLNAAFHIGTNRAGHMEVQTALSDSNIVESTRRRVRTP